MADDLFLKIDFGEPSASDTGDRPYPGTHPFWANTSIFLSGGVSRTETRVGLPTTVKVRVSNRGEAPVEDVRVDAYVLSPFVGLTSPGQAVVTLQSGLATISPGSGTPSDTDSHVLSCLLAGPSGSGPWTPTAAQLQDFGGHLCLKANCYADGDGGALPGGATFDVAGDRRQGQRNISLLAATMAIQRSTILRFRVMPAPRGRRTLLEVVRLSADAVGRGERELLASHPAVVVIKGTGRYAQLGVPGPDGEPVPIRLTQRRPRFHLEVEGFEPGQAMQLPGFREPLPALVELDSLLEERPGTLHAVEITQRDERSRPLGGLRVLGLRLAD